MSELRFKSWDPLTGGVNSAYLFRAARLLREVGGKRDLPYWMSLDGECETGEFHTLTEPLHDEVFGTEVAFPYKFDPTYCPYRLSELQDMNTPENIAVCHKGDLFAPWVPSSVIYEVLNAAASAPLHQYFFLTRFPERYLEFPMKSPNSIYGVWIDRQGQLQRLLQTEVPDVRYLVMEPMRSRIDLEQYLKASPHKPEWILLGTGRLRYRKLIQPEWLSEIAETCRRHRIPLYMKKPLHALAGNHFTQEINPTLFW